LLAFPCLVGAVQGEAIVGVDKYGGKQPCGRRAKRTYKTKAGGKVHVCETHSPSPLADFDFWKIFGL
jgi:hypothetical protein